MKKNYTGRIVRLRRNWDLSTVFGVCVRQTEAMGIACLNVVPKDNPLGAGYSNLPIDCTAGWTVVDDYIDDSLIDRLLSVVGDALRVNYTLGGADTMRNLRCAPGRREAIAEQNAKQSSVNWCNVGYGTKSASETKADESSPLVKINRAPLTGKFAFIELKNDGLLCESGEYFVLEESEAAYYCVPTTCPTDADEVLRFNKSDVRILRSYKDDSYLVTFVGMMIDYVGQNKSKLSTEAYARVHNVAVQLTRAAERTALADSFSKFLDSVFSSPANNLFSSPARNAGKRNDTLDALILAAAYGKKPSFCC